MSTQNDHETHNVCNERLEREGGKATCCDCDPHEGCTLGDKGTRNELRIQQRLKVKEILEVIK